MSHFNVAGLKEQLLELHETMNEPDFWNDLKRSTEVSRKVRISVPQERRQVAEAKETNLEQAKAAGGPAGTRKAAKKVGRNDPCPCGSGKKYKNCCGKNEG